MCISGGLIGGAGGAAVGTAGLAAAAAPAIGLGAWEKHQADKQHKRAKEIQREALRAAAAEEAAGRAATPREGQALEMAAAMGESRRKRGVRQSYLASMADGGAAKGGSNLGV
jgi:hypothetical protein